MNIYHKRRRAPLRVPRYSTEPPEQPACSLFERCQDCPYPRHGFICWGHDGDCLRTDMEKLSERRS